MKSTTLLAATLLLVLSRAATVDAAESASDYAGAIPLATSGNAALYRLDLPDAVYAGVRHPDLRDVRVSNGAGEFVPYAIVGGTQQQPPAATAFAPPVFPIRGEAGKTPEQVEVTVTQRADGSVVSVRTRLPATGRSRAATPAPIIAYLVDLTRIEASVAAIRPVWKEAPVNFIAQAFQLRNIKRVYIKHGG